MIRIQNITGETHQRHVILFEESEIVLIMRFYPTVEMWCIDVEYKGKIASGYKLSCGVLHMQSRNFPFDFMAQDLTSSGLDPFRADDFVTDRCALYMLQADDMEAIRGAPVPL